MPLLGFQKQFVESVESGEKRQAIRAYRKDGRDPKVGDRLHLYTGLRTKQCRKLGEAVCTFSGRFALDGRRMESIPGAWIDADATLNGIDLDYTEFSSLSEIAKRDGFKDAVPMLEWFDNAHGLPFEGVLIRWGDIEKPEDSASGEGA